MQLSAALQAAPCMGRLSIRTTRPDDIPGIIELCRQVYPDSPPWSETQLSSHQKVFPEGQFVAQEMENGRIVGAAASLIVLWDDYDMDTNWRDFTESGMFTNHDPERGRTLYGAEVMVHPGWRGEGIGKALYAARRELARQLGLLRIRAGARLANYHKYAGGMSPETYVESVVNEEIGDPTLSFQLGQGFHVLAVIQNYLRHDPESLGYAAVIEWINSRVAKSGDYSGIAPRFMKRLAAVASG